MPVSEMVFNQMPVHEMFLYQMQVSKLVFNQTPVSEMVLDQMQVGKKVFNQKASQWNCFWPAASRQKDIWPICQLVKWLATKCNLEK